MKTNSPFLKFVKEIAIVVIGVLIAVSINKVKEDIDNRNYIATTLNTVEKEINTSKESLKRVADRHVEILEAITADIDNETETLSEIILGLGGIQGADIKNIGLRFFINNKAELIEYDVISNLSDIENASDLIKQKMDRLVNFSFSASDKKDKINKNKFLMHLRNLIGTEYRLLELYSEFTDKKMEPEEVAGEVVEEEMEKKK